MVLSGEKVVGSVGEVLVPMKGGKATTSANTIEVGEAQKERGPSSIVGGAVPIDITHSKSL